MSRPALLVLFAVVGAAMVMIGMRWTLIERAGTSIPQHDQWQAEPDYLYLPWQAGHVHLEHFLTPHNGHRIAMTRALALALFVGNQEQWDGKLQTTVNAVLAAAILIPLAALLSLWLPPPALVMSVGGLSLLYGSVILYENALWGFQSQFYFLILLSCWQLGGVLMNRAFSLWWWVSHLAGLAALFSFASGWMASALAVCLLGYREWPDRGRMARVITPLLILTVLGVVMTVTGTPSGGDSIAMTEDKLGLIVQLLSFPSRTSTLWAALWWAPFTVFAARTLAQALRLPAKSTNAELWLLGTGGWVLMHVIAMGLTRQGFGEFAPNRYLDVMAVGAVANLAALGWSHRFCRTTSLHRVGWSLVGMGWFAGFFWHGWSTHQLHRTAVEPILQDIYAEQRERVSTFYQTKDATVIREVIYPHVPSSVPDQFEAQLRSPAITRMLPLEIQPPLPLHFPNHPELNNALPTHVPHTAGVLNQGTYLASGSAATIVATSAPLLLPPGAFFRINLAGRLQPDGNTIRLEPTDHDPGNDVRFELNQFESPQQRAITLKVPAASSQLVVADHSTAHWIAWSHPNWEGRWSKFASDLRGAADFIRLTGLAVLVGGLVLTLFPLPRKKIPAHKLGSAQPLKPR